MTSVVVGVDVGGTTTAAGAVTGRGEVLIEERAPTHGDGPGTAGRTIVGLIESILDRAADLGLRPSAIGVGFPVSSLMSSASSRIVVSTPLARL